MNPHENLFQMAWFLLLGQNPELTQTMSQVLLQVNGYKIDPETGQVQGSPSNEPLQIL